MKDTVFSYTTGRTYSPSDCVKIINTLQAAAYMRSGAEVLDFFPSTDRITGKDVLVFVFNKERTRDLYKKWCEHGL